MSNQPKPICKPHEIEPAEQRRYIYLHVAPAGVTLEQVCEPSYWAPVTGELRRARWARIEVVCDDGSWEADLRVYATGEGFAKVRVLQSWAFSEKVERKPKTPDGYRIEHIPSQGWRALTPAGDVIADRKQVESEAINAAREHAKASRVEAQQATQQAA